MQLENEAPLDAVVQNEDVAALADVVQLEDEVLLEDWAHRTTRYCPTTWHSTTWPRTRM